LRSTSLLESVPFGSVLDGIVLGRHVLVFGEALALVRIGLSQDIPATIHIEGVVADVRIPSIEQLCPITLLLFKNRICLFDRGGERDGAVFINALIEEEGGLAEEAVLAFSNLDGVEADKLALRIADSQQFHGNRKHLRVPIGTERNNDLLVSHRSYFRGGVNFDLFLTLILLIIVAAGDDQVDAGRDLDLHLMNGNAEAVVGEGGL